MRESPDTYGEWPDYVEEVVAGEIWLRDPFCPGPEWVDVETWTSTIVPDPKNHSKPLTLRKWVKRNDS